MGVITHHLLPFGPAFVRERFFLQAACWRAPAAGFSLLTYSGEKNRANCRSWEEFFGKVSADLSRRRRFQLRRGRRLTQTHWLPAPISQRTPDPFHRAIPKMPQ